MQNKRKLFLIRINSNDHKLKILYKKYNKILSEVIILTKKTHCNNLIVNSKNMTKTTWNIITTVSSNKTNTNNISMINVNNNLSNDS